MTLGSTQVIVSEILYDSLGRQAITTVPVVKQDFPSSTIDASPFGFSSDLISSRDPQASQSTWVNGGVLDGSITSWVNPTSFCLEGDSNYAYQGVYYETDPTSRTLQSSKPGITFQKSDNFSNPGYSESYYANYFPQEIYSILYSSPIQIPDVDGQDTAFTSPNSFPYMPMSAQQTNLGNNGLVTQASWADNAGRLQGRATVDANNIFVLQSLSFQTGATLSQGIDSSTSQCAIMGQLQTYLPNYFDSSVKDPTSFYVLKQVNALGQVVQTYSPDQNNTVYYTDLYGRLRYSQTADQLLAGMIQYYLYDNLNRIIEVGLYPGTWNVDYSDVDSFQQNTLTLITPQPDQAQIQKSITYDGLPTLPFDPNAQGKIAQVVTYPSVENTPSPTCVVEVYTYDTWGRMISVAKAIVNTDEDSPFTEGSFITQYTYSGFSKVLEITSTSNNTVFDVSYNYNLQGLVNQISYSPNGDDENIYPLASYIYNEQGQIAAEVLFDSNASTSIVTSSYAYGNSLHQLTNISTVLSPLNAPENITPLFNEKICYTDDPSGDNTKGTYQDGNIQLTAYAYGMNAESNYQLQYAYDAFGRLYCAGATPGWVGAWAGFGSTNPYGNFDSNGNYLLDMTYNNIGTNQISQASALSQRTPYTTAIFNYTKGGSGLTSSISYSSTNEEYLPYTMTITSDLITQRPLQITQTNPDKTADAFLYDRKGERIQKVISSNNSSSITTYARGKGAQVLAEYDGNNNPQAYYIYGPLGLVSLYDPTNQQNSFILKDHLGSSRIVFNATTNEVTSYYGYDSFGNPFLNKSTQDNAVVLRYLYTGQEWDQELGLYNYHARQYDPLYTKRFLSPDPAHQFPSPYTYCANNPINFKDPTGKMDRFISCFSSSSNSTNLQPGYVLESGTIDAINGLFSNNAEATKDLVSGGLTGLYNRSTGQIIARRYSSSGTRTGSNYQIDDEVTIDGKPLMRQAAVRGEGSAHEVMANNFFEPSYNPETDSIVRFLSYTRTENPWPAALNFPELRGWSISRLISDDNPLMNGDNLIVRFGSDSLNRDRPDTFIRYIGEQDRIGIMNALAEQGNFRNIMYYPAAVPHMNVSPVERTVINQISNLHLL